MKRGEFNTAWRVRWFVLGDGILAYFRSREAAAAAAEREEAQARRRARFRGARATVAAAAAAAGAGAGAPLGARREAGSFAPAGLSGALGTISLAQADVRVCQGAAALGAVGGKGRAGRAGGPGALASPTVSLAGSVGGGRAARQSRVHLAGGVGDGSAAAAAGSGDGAVWGWRGRSQSQGPSTGARPVTEVTDDVSSPLGSDVPAERCFEIVTRTRVYYFAAQSKVDMIDWVRRLSACTTFRCDNVVIEQAEEIIAKTSYDAFLRTYGDLNLSADSSSDDDVR